MNIFYLSINEDEERCINIERLREVFRVKDSIGYVYDDGKVSTAKLASKEDAEDAFKTVYNMMNPPIAHGGEQILNLADFNFSPPSETANV